MQDWAAKQPYYAKDNDKGKVDRDPKKPRRSL